MSNGLLTTGQTTPRATRPRGPAWVRFAIGFVTFFLAMGAGTLLWLVPPLPSLAARATTSVTSGAVLQIAQFATMSLLVILGVWLLMRFLDRRPLRESGLRLTASSPLWLLVGMGVSAALVLGIGMPLDAAGMLRELPTSSTAPLALIVAFVLAKSFLLQGLPEELVFRGYMLQTMRGKPLTAVIASTLVFGVMHIISNGGQQNFTERLIYLLPPTGFALVAGALVLLTRSLWAAVGVHGGFHVANAIGNSMGMGEGPVFNTAVGIGFIVVGVVLLGVWNRRRSPDEQISLVR